MNGCVDWLETEYNANIMHDTATDSDCEETNYATNATADAMAIRVEKDCYILFTSVRL